MWRHKCSKPKRERQTLRKKARDAMMRRHGVEPAPPPPKPQFSVANKTLAMRLLERQHGEDIIELLKPRKGEKDLYAVGKRLGINYTTVCKWRKRLGYEAADLEGVSTLEASKARSPG
jgi:hypothetical protein